MLFHPSDGQLRASLDGEFDATTHLAQCARCRARTATLREQAAAAHTLFTVLPAPESVSPRRAWLRLTSRLNKESSFMFRSPYFRPFVLGGVVVAAIALLFTFAPAQQAFSSFLGLFRVQQVTVLDLDMTQLDQLGSNATLAKQIGQVFSKSTTVTREPQAAVTVDGAAAASQTAGFTVRLPANRADLASLTVESGAAFEMVLDRERAQAILNEMGRSDLHIPAAADGARIGVDMSAAVIAAYGECPAPDATETRYGDYLDCTLFGQVPSPQVNTPPGFDIATFAEIGLQLTGMSAEEARAFAQTVDWTSTLVIPIPRNAASYKEVTVDGVEGYLIRRPAGEDPAQLVVIWVKDGIIYTISALSSDATNALAIANSLK